MSSEQLVEHIYNLGRALWRSTLTGGPAQARELRERMMHPKPGDLVIEISTFPRNGFDTDRVGRLLRTEGNPQFPHRWVIEPLLRPGHEQGWSNAEFVAIPNTARTDQWSGLAAARSADQ